jgi:hypothetical protein
MRAYILVSGCGRPQKWMLSPLFLCLNPNENFINTLYIKRLCETKPETKPLQTAQV